MLIPTIDETHAWPEGVLLFEGLDVSTALDRCVKLIFEEGRIIRCFEPGRRQRAKRFIREEVARRRLAKGRSC